MMIVSYLLANTKGIMVFLGGSDSKENACSVGDLGSMVGLGRSPGGGHGNPLQYSCLNRAKFITRNDMGDNEQSLSLIEF